MSDPVLQQISNFLVPAAGNISAVVYREVFGATPVLKQFNNFELDGIPFRPYGVLIDNTTGTVALNVLINEISFNISCAAGKSLQMPFPAPLNFTVNITGDPVNLETVVFVNYPLIPFVSP